MKPPRRKRSKMDDLVRARTSRRRWSAPSKLMPLGAAIVAYIRSTCLFFLQHCRVVSSYLEQSSCEKVLAGFHVCHTRMHTWTLYPQAGPRADTEWNRHLEQSRLPLPALPCHATQDAFLVCGTASWGEQTACPACTPQEYHHWRKDLWHGFMYLSDVPAKASPCESFYVQKLAL